MLSGTLPDCPNIEWRLENGVLILSGTGDIGSTDSRYLIDGYQVSDLYITGNIQNIVYSFQGLDSLKNVVIDAPVISIGGYSFEDCKSLKTLVLPNSLQTIGEYAFTGCSSLISVTIPKSVQSMENAFFSCDSLQEVIVQEGVTSIGYKAFAECPSLKFIGLPNSLQTIGELAFYHTGFKEINIPHNVSSIGKKAFQTCRNLQNVIIPENVLSIGQSAFDETDLSTVKFPNSISSVNTAFGAWWTENYVKHAVHSLVFAGGSNSLFPSFIDGWAPRFQYVAFEDNCTYAKILANSFEHSSALAAVVLPDSVTEIEPNAFSSSLKWVFLPPSVTTIASDAFSGSNVFVCIPDTANSATESAIAAIQTMTCVKMRDLGYSLPPFSWQTDNWIFRDDESVQPTASEINRFASVLEAYKDNFGIPHYVAYDNNSGVMTDETAFQMQPAVQGEQFLSSQYNALVCGIRTVAGKYGALRFVRKGEKITMSLLNALSDALNTVYFKTMSERTQT